MEKQPTYKELEKEIERLRVEIRSKEERIIWLERMLFGSKRDGSQTLFSQRADILRRALRQGPRGERREDCQDEGGDSKGGPGAPQLQAPEAQEAGGVPVLGP